MTNKNTKSRYTYGVNIISHRGYSISTSFGSKEYDSYRDRLYSTNSHEIGYIPNGYKNRPDLISDVFYNSPNNWWLLMEANGIIDPFEKFNINERIIIPTM